MKNEKDGRSKMEKDIMKEFEEKKQELLNALKYENLTINDIIEIDVFDGVHPFSCNYNQELSNLLFDYENDYNFKIKFLEILNMWEPADLIADAVYSDPYKNRTTNCMRYDCYVDIKYLDDSEMSDVIHEMSKSELFELFPEMDESDVIKLPIK